MGRKSRVESVRFKIGDTVEILPTIATRWVGSEGTVVAVTHNRIAQTLDKYEGFASEPQARHVLGHPINDLDRIDEEVKRRPGHRSRAARIQKPQGDVMDSFSFEG